MEEKNIVHLKKVVEILRDSDESFSVDSLRVLVFEKFGEDVKFKNCSDGVLSFNELISFMESKGKIEIVDGILVLRGCSCSSNK